MASCLLKLLVTEVPISLGLFYKIVGAGVVRKGSGQLHYQEGEGEGQVVALVAYSRSILNFSS